METYTPNPVNPLRTNRGLLKTILFSIITLGIYPIVMYSHMSEEINEVAKADGKKTMHYCLLFFLVAPITLGIGALVWNHRFCTRLGNQLMVRGINYQFGAGTFWGWGFFGSLLFGIGPLVYTYKMLKAMNLVNLNYNSASTTTPPTTETFES